MHALLAEMASAPSGVESMSLHVLARLCGELRRDRGEAAARQLLDEVGEQLMASFARDWQAGEEARVITDLITVFKHQGGGNMVPVDETTIREKGALGPGQMIAVDMGEGRLYHDAEMKDKLAAAQPYGDWIEKIVDLNSLLRDDPKERGAVHLDLAFDGLGIGPDERQGQFSGRLCLCKAGLQQLLCGLEVACQ